MQTIYPRCSPSPQPLLNKPNKCFSGTSFYFLSPSQAQNSKSNVPCRLSKPSMTLQDHGLCLLSSYKAEVAAKGRVSHAESSSAVQNVITSLMHTRSLARAVQVPHNSASPAIQTYVCNYIWLHPSSATHNARRAYPCGLLDCLSMHCIA